MFARFLFSYLWQAALLTALLCAAGLAGAPTEDKFEVISIKPTNPQREAIGGRGNSHGGFSAQGITTDYLVEQAFPGIRYRFQISNAPSWFFRTQYDVEAKPIEIAIYESGRAAEDLYQARMRSLLTDRFQLKAHRIAKVLPVYELVAANGDSKLQRSGKNPEYSFSIHSGVVSAKEMSIAQLIGGVLESELGRIVLDKTGLSGEYRFSLKWRSAPQMLSPALTAGADSGPSLFTALEEQLGLKLISTKGPVDILVIDHIEKPSAN